MKKVLAAAAVAVALTAGQSYGFSLNNYLGDVSMNLQGYTENSSQVFGMFELKALNAIDPAGPTIWSPSTNDYVFGLLYGLDYANDINLKNGSFMLFTQSTWLDIEAINPNEQGFDFNTYISNVPNANILLTGDFRNIDGVSIFQSQSSKPSTTFDGSGWGWADVTGGSLKSTFDSNAQDFGADLAMSFNFFGQSPLPNFANTDGWDYFISDPINATAVPEPSTMMLLGLGMFGLAVYGKRRMDKNKA